MAKKELKIAESDISAKNRGRRSVFSPVRTLFGTREKHVGDRQVEDHAHAWWQLEIVTQGTIVGRFQRQARAMEAGTVALVPPGVVHGFRYPIGPSAYLSVKFEVPGAPAGLASALIFAPEIYRDFVLCAETLAKRLPPAFNGEDPTYAVSLSLLEGLIGGLLATALTECPASSLASPTFALKAWARRQGSGPLKVAAAARALKVHPKTLARLVRRETGKSVKACLDTVRADIAGDLLRLSDMNVKEVADMLGFSDAYAFSRFFKRRAGVSPGRFIRTRRVKTSLAFRT